MVTKGTPVTIWCQASVRADGYYLYKERISEPFLTETSQDSSNKAGFSLTSVTSHSAGRYQCVYQSGRSWSQRSDYLPLVVTGKGRSRSLPPGASCRQKGMECGLRGPSLTVHSVWGMWGTWGDGL